MSGRVGDLSPKQAEILQQFRQNIADILPLLPAQHDHYLLRWLRARSFNLQKTEAMIRKHVEFRKHMKADTIIEDWKNPEVIEKYLSGGLCGYDKEGNPVWYDIIGPLDPKGLMMSVSKQDFMKSKIRDTEMLRLECQRQSEKLGKNIEAITLIYDCEGLGVKHLWKPALEIYTDILTMFEENYPESLHKVFLIKAPMIFPMAFNLVKHFLSEETRRKIIVVGSNWKEVLQEHIDPAEIPMIYGGTRTDPDGDPRCISKIKYGGIVPRSYYILDSSGVKVQYDNSVTIRRGSDLQLEYDINTPNTLLRWQFMSEGEDIGFGVFKRTQNGGEQKLADMVLMVPNERYNAHMVPEDNSLTCTEAGVYVLRFDNTYSVLKSKKVSYTVEIVAPDGQMQSIKSRGEGRRGSRTQ